MKGAIAISAGSSPTNGSCTSRGSAWSISVSNGAKSNCPTLGGSVFAWGSTAHSSRQLCPVGEMSAMGCWRSTSTAPGEAHQSQIVPRQSVALSAFEGDRLPGAIAKIPQAEARSHCDLSRSLMINVNTGLGDGHPGQPQSQHQQAQTSPDLP